MNLKKPLSGRVISVVGYIAQVDMGDDLPVIGESLRLEENPQASMVVVGGLGQG